MPTLTRLLFIVAAIALSVYAVMAALVYLVRPVPQPLEVDVPLPQLRTPQQPATAAPPTVDAGGRP